MFLEIMLVLAMLIFVIGGIFCCAWLLREIIRLLKGKNETITTDD